MIYNLPFWSRFKPWFATTVKTSRQVITNMLTSAIAERTFVIIGAFCHVGIGSITIVTKAHISAGQIDKL